MSTRTRGYYDYIVAAQQIAENLRSGGSNTKREIGSKKSVKTELGLRRKADQVAAEGTHLAIYRVKT